MGYEAYTSARDAGLRNGERRRTEQEQERQRGVSMEAGKAFEAGNIDEAANAFFRGGDIGSGITVRKEGERVETDARNRQRTAVAAAATGLVYVPAAERAEVFRSRIVPFLVSEGVPQAVVDQITPDQLSDGNLRSIIAQMSGTVPSPFANDRAGPNNSILRGDPVTGEYGVAYKGEFDPRAGAAPGYMWTDETRTRQVFIPGGPNDPTVARARAEATRAPRAPRRGGGGSRPSGAGAAPGPASGGQSSLPSGFRIRPRSR